MRAFGHHEVKGFAEARRKMCRGTVLIADGTDLVPLMRDGLVEPRNGPAIRVPRSGATFGAGIPEPSRAEWVLARNLVREALSE